ncbi:MAG: serine/threonine protein kinase [Candidatus Obscuribacterales bacterium]|nr:serine/threonine protein kinase [Candidatus Obscuribacterales bacterium]
MHYSNHLGDISFDAESLRAERGELSCELSLDELHVLETACKYPNWQASSLELAQAVSTDEHPVDELRLSQIILSLRHKLDPMAEIVFPHLFSSTETATFSRQKDPYIGRLLNERYVLTRYIGGGSSSIVYQGMRREDEYPVAVKMLIIHSRTNAETKARFDREARLNSELIHPNIVRVLDFGIDLSSQPFLVMELLEGASLLEIVNKHGAPSTKELLGFLMQVLEGLSYAHGRGIVHRDIKPSNMMLTGSGDSGFIVKIVDFGLARMTENEPQNTEVTQSGQVVGSPPYMSPEQCRGETVDHRSDIYSFGCSLYELLQGRLPFSAEEPVGVMIKHLKEPVPKLEVQGLEGEALSRLNKVVAGCLAKDREKRYQSAAEALKDLRVAAEGLDKGQQWEPKNKVLSWLAARFRQ